MEYRNLKIGEGGLVRDLFASYYDAKVYCMESRYFEWLHVNNLHRLECVAEDELTVLGAVDDNGLHGCITYLPGAIYAQGQRHSAVFTTESLALPESRGVYGLLARRLVGRFDYAFVMGATPFLRDLFVKQLGAEYSHEMCRLVLIGDVPSLMTLLESREAPSPVDLGQLEAWSEETRRFAAGPSAGGRSTESQRWVRLETASEIRDTYWQDMLSSGVPCSRRDPAWLDWRYSCHPHIRYEIIAAEPSQRSGVAIIRQETVGEGGVRAMRLLEFLPTRGGATKLASAVAARAIDAGCAMLDFFCAHHGWIEAFPPAFLRPHQHLPFEIPYLLQPPEWRPRRSINLLSMRNRRRRQQLPVLDDGLLYLTKGDGAQDVALDKGLPIGSSSRRRKLIPTMIMALRSEILDVFSGLGKELEEAHQESIVSAGLLDSLSILELVNALEERFDIFFEEDDLTLENFDKLSTIETLVKTRQGESGA